jgi:hypothetical protein
MVVRNQFDFADSQVEKYSDGGVVLPGIRIETEVCIGINCVEAQILQVIGFEFIDKPDTAAFLPQVNDYAAFFGGHTEGCIQLVTTIAAHGTEYIACHTFGMYPDWYGRGRVESFSHQCQMRHEVGVTVGVGHHRELAIRSGYWGFSLSEHI